MKTILIMMIIFVLSTISYTQISKTSSPSSSKSTKTTINKSDTLSTLSKDSVNILSPVVVFVEMSPNLQKFGYTGVHANENSLFHGLDYKDYVGKKATIIKEIKREYSPGYILQLENGETLFADYSKDRFDASGKYHTINDLAYISDIEIANSLIGKTVFINGNKNSFGNNNFHNWDENGEITEEIKSNNLQPVKVLKLYLKINGHGGNPFSSFYLLVEMENGKTAYIGFEYVYREMPSEFSKFDKKTQEAITGHKVILGMTKEAVILSWGEPKDIHKTVGSWGVHEQWVYGSRTFLYFEDGKLTSWQD